MLGYVKVEKGELKVREYDIYCGYYCGICKSIGRRYGQFPRMSLSYDAAFLAILLAAMDDAPDAPTAEHCIVHHIKKKPVIENKAIDYAGDIMLLLAWYKLMDDAQDEGKLYAKSLMVFLRRIYKKLRIKYELLCDEMEMLLRELHSIEKAKTASIDMAAEPFSKIMELIFRVGVSYTYSGEHDSVQDIQNKLGAIGYHMGKWIYLIDAIDDIDENIESGAYNPLLYRFDYAPEHESIAEFKTRIKDTLNYNLYQYLAVLSNQTASLNFTKNQGIIDNVIYFGLNRKTEEILKGEQDESI